MCTHTHKILMQSSLLTALKLLLSLEIRTGMNQVSSCLSLSQSPKGTWVLWPKKVCPSVIHWGFKKKKLYTYIYTHTHRVKYCISCSLLVLSISENSGALGSCCVVINTKKKESNWVITYLLIQDCCRTKVWNVPSLPCCSAAFSFGNHSSRKM